MYPVIPNLDVVTSHAHQPFQSTTRQSTIPDLKFPESVRWTHTANTNPYTTNRSVTEIPGSSLSKLRRYYSGKQSTNQNTLRRFSVPHKPIDSSQEPTHRHKSFITDNNMLTSASKLDNLLLRLFSRFEYKNIHHNEVPSFNSQPIENSDDNKSNNKTNVIDKDTNQTSLQVFEINGVSDVINMDPVMWHLRPINASEKETLESELPYLEESLQPKEVVRRLFMDGILTHQDYNQLSHTEGQGDRAVVRLLIRTLLRRGEKAYPAFLKALRELDYVRICDKLEQTEREITLGLEYDRDDFTRRTAMAGLASRLPSNTDRVDIDDQQTVLDLETSSPVSDSNNNTLPDDKVTSPKQRETSREEYDRQVEQQLTELNAELKALHEDINMLRSSRTNSTQEVQGPEHSRPNQPPKSSSCILL